MQTDFSLEYKKNLKYFAWIIEIEMWEHKSPQSEFIETAVRHTFAKIVIKIKLSIRINVVNERIRCVCRQSLHAKHFDSQINFPMNNVDNDSVCKQICAQISDENYDYVNKMRLLQSNLFSTWNALSIINIITCNLRTFIQLSIQTLKRY